MTSIAVLVASVPLRMGETGPAVTAVQLALRNAGYDLEADGGFGAITQTALKAFEASHGLQPDDVVDEPTAAELDKVAPRPSVLKVAPGWTVRWSRNDSEETKNRADLINVAGKRARGWGKK